MDVFSLGPVHVGCLNSAKRHQSTQLFGLSNLNGNNNMFLYDEFFAECGVNSKKEH